jgi:uridine kinase
VLSFAQAKEIVGGRSDSRLIAIDGLPCAGKSTLATQLVDSFGCEAIYLDDFALPPADWASAKVGFPFTYMRYDDFLRAVVTLANTGRCQYAPFDWEKLEISSVTRTVTLDRPVIVEGVASLHPQISPLYSLRFYVESDRGSILATAAARGDAHWHVQWRDLFLPSVDVYMESRPCLRADHVVAGRGAEKAGREV